MKKRFFILVILLLAASCFALQTSAAQEDAEDASGLLLAVMPEEEADEWSFLFVSADPAEGKLMCTQIPADQAVSLHVYNGHFLSRGLTMGNVCTLGYAWEEDAGAIEISTAAVQTSFQLFPAYTLLLSAEDAACIFRQALDELHIAKISPDKELAFERVVVGLQGLDASAQSSFAEFVAAHGVSDADENAISTYLSEMIGSSSGCEMVTLQPA